MESKMLSSSRIRCAMRREKVGRRPAPPRPIQILIQVGRLLQAVVVQVDQTLRERFPGMADVSTPQSCEGPSLASWPGKPLGS